MQVSKGPSIRVILGQWSSSRDGVDSKLTQFTQLKCRLQVSNWSICWMISRIIIKSRSFSFLKSILSCLLGVVMPNLSSCSVQTHVKLYMSDFLGFV